jgi:hypothetical protein
MASYGNKLYSLRYWIGGIAFATAVTQYIFTHGLMYEVFGLDGIYLTRKRRPHAQNAHIAH